jgi:hypothetical protein
MGGGWKWLRIVSNGGFAVSGTELSNSTARKIVTNEI